MNKLQKTALSQLSKWLEQFPTQALSEFPIDLETLCSQWGVDQVVRRQLDVSGLLRRLESGRFVIFVNENDPQGRQRFSLAHELGHIIMPQSEGLRAYCRDNKQRDRDLERSCDIIAAELLMPRQIFCIAAAELGWGLKAVRKLASLFQVSVIAAAIRLFELSPEPLLISSWSSNQGALDNLKLNWSRPNALARQLKPEIRWKTEPANLRPLYQAHAVGGLIAGDTKILMKVDGESKYHSVSTEGLKVGGSVRGSVLGFHYLTRTM